MARVAAVHHPPWHVLGLPRARSAAQVAGWRYVVLEEIIDDVALLRRWGWPLADERGHLVWPHVEQQDYTTTPVSVLREQLYGPSGLRRDPRIGDTFAVIAETAAGPWPGRTGNLGALLQGRVFDVSAEARLAARLAYQGSLAAVLPSPPTSTDDGAASGAAPRRFRAPELTVAPPQPIQRRTP